MVSVFGVLFEDRKGSGDIIRCRLGGWGKERGTILTLLSALVVIVRVVAVVDPNKTELFCIFCIGTFN